MSLNILYMTYYCLKTKIYDLLKTSHSYSYMTHSNLRVINILNNKYYDGKDESIFSPKVLK